MSKKIALHNFIIIWLALILMLVQKISAYGTPRDKEFILDIFYSSNVAGSLEPCM